jgi:hypothetical protein
MKRLLAFLLSVSAISIAAEPLEAQELPPLATFQMMLDANKSAGWVQFREYEGRQWVYFSALQSMHCGLSEIRYSINSEDLGQTFPLVDCVPALPFSLPPDAGPETTAMALGSGEARFISIQVVWSDGTESEIVKFKPCDGVGEAVCGTIAE